MLPALACSSFTCHRGVVRADVLCAGSCVEEICCHSTTPLCKCSAPEPVLGTFCDTGSGQTCLSTENRSWECFQEGTFCVHAPTVCFTRAERNQPCNAVVEEEECNRQLACVYLPPRLSHSWQCDAAPGQRPVVQADCSTRSTKQECEAQWECQWQLVETNQTDQKPCKNWGLYTGCVGRYELFDERCEGHDRRACLQDAQVCEYKDTCDCLPGFWGERCEKEIAQFQSNFTESCNGVNAPTCRGLVYMAAADIDHCSENATCHEWEDIKDVVGALLAAELATMIVDILGFCLQVLLLCWFCWLSAHIRELKKRSEELQTSLDDCEQKSLVDHELNSLVERNKEKRRIAVCSFVLLFLEDVVLEIIVVSKVVNASYVFDNVKAAHCFPQGAAYDTIKDLTETTQRIREYAIVNIVFACIGGFGELLQICMEVEIGEDDLRTTSKMRWFLCGWALSMLGNIVELIFSIVNFADQTQKLVIDLNSLEQKIVGEVPLEETDRVCFLRHPELPQVSAVEVASQLEFIFVPLVVAFGLVLLAIPLWYNIPWRVASKLWICIKEGTRAAVGSPPGDTEDPAQSQRSTALGSPPGDTEEGTEEPGDTEDREDGKGKGFKGDKGDGKGKKGEKGDGFGKSSGKGFDKGYGKDGKGKGKVHPGTTDSEDDPAGTTDPQVSEEEDLQNMPSF
ncbi:Uncharacterized protein SCF082_LOCUS31499 [Durusdinium trenchii]|uniref:EGF-like domain-containing protein n=1 Tax=Durusdinium trenchii TaxID=1381693 RepID=A0ABP0N7M5_9DINO